MQKRIDWVKSQIARWWWGLINYETMRHSHLHFVFVFIKQKEERKKVFLFCYQNSWKLYVLEGKRVYVLGWLTWNNESNQYTFDVWCVIVKIISAWTIEREVQIFVLSLPIISVTKQQNNRKIWARDQDFNAMQLRCWKANQIQDLTYFNWEKNCENSLVSVYFNLYPGF